MGGGAHPLLRQLKHVVVVCPRQSLIAADHNVANRSLFRRNLRAGVQKVVVELGRAVKNIRNGGIDFSKIGHRLLQLALGFAQVG